jgi:hypothetical protein
VATKAISGKIAAFYKQSGSATTMTDEACTDSGDHKSYYVTDTNKMYIDPDTTVVVEKQTDGEGEFATVSSDDYTIQYLGGYVVFDEANGATDVIQVTGKYLPTTQLAGAFNWSLEINWELKDWTNFSHSGHKNYLAICQDWSGTCEMYWIETDDEITNELSGDLGDRLVCAFYTSDGDDNFRYLGFGRISGINPNMDTNELVKQSISITGTGTEQLRYREG